MSKRPQTPQCYACCRREGETTLVAEERPRGFGQPHPVRWYWLDEQPSERSRQRGQKGPLPPVWRDNLGAFAFKPVLDGAQSRILVILYAAKGEMWDGELVCGECLAGLTLDDRGEDATFTRREVREPVPVEQMELTL